MNQQIFYDYKFDINTKIKVKGEWKRVVEIDFDLELINGFPIDDIDMIGQSKNLNLTNNK